MKKFILIIAVLFSIQVSAQVPNYVPKNGLLGFWPFTGNANDSSGNGKHGTINGATLTADRFGVANRAYYFNNGNYFQLTSFPLNISSNFSVAFWKKLIGYRLGDCVMDINEGFNCAQGPVIYEFADSIRLAKCGSDASGRGFGSKDSSLNKWVHYAFTYNNGSNKVYRNGKFIQNAVMNFSSTSSVYITFANDANAGIQYDQGCNIQLDEIGIWSRELRAGEVDTLYKSLLTTSSIVTPDNKILAFELYPNPTKTTIKILMHKGSFNARFVITDILGKFIKDGFLENHSNDIDITGLSVGAYFVDINGYKLKFIVD